MLGSPGKPRSHLRISDYVSLGAIAHHFPPAQIDAVLERTARSSKRHRQLPAQVVVYYVIALALYAEVSYREVLRCLLEGLRWFAPFAALVRITTKSGISQARQRLGAEPLRQLHDELVRPVATPHTQGSWYQRWKLVSTISTPACWRVSLN